MSFYCPVTGWSWMYFDDDVFRSITGDPDDILEDDPVEKLREGLSYLEDDIDANNELVTLVTPSRWTNRRLDIARDLYQNRADLPRNVSYLFDVDVNAPIDAQTRETVTAFRPGSDSDRRLSCYPINLSAFLIMQHLLPEMSDARVFHHLVKVADVNEFGVFADIDYGPVQKTHRHDVEYARIGEGVNDEDDWEKVYRWWRDLLTQRGKSEEERLRDAWMGPGNLWVYKHPGKFPIKETVCFTFQSSPSSKIFGRSTGLPSGLEPRSSLARLPLELQMMIIDYLAPEDAMRLSSTCKLIWGQFRPTLDLHAYRYIKGEKPWYLPVGPVNCNRGHREIYRWEREWDRHAGLDVRKVRRESLPWLGYYLACRRSPNIRSRERIWKIVLQLKDLVQRHKIV